MRLIDAERFEELFNQQVEFGATDLFDAVEDALQDTESIDPEALPIVRELREKLKKLTDILHEQVKELDRRYLTVERLENELSKATAERDAAIADLYSAKACKTCALQFSDDCLLEECFEPCSAVLSENTPYKWRGIQEAQDNE